MVTAWRSTASLHDELLTQAGLAFPAEFFLAGGASFLVELALGLVQGFGGLGCVPYCLFVGFGHERSVDVAIPTCSGKYPSIWR